MEYPYLWLTWLEWGAGESGALPSNFLLLTASLVNLAIVFSLWFEYDCDTPLPNWGIMSEEQQLLMYLKEMQVPESSTYKPWSWEIYLAFPSFWPNYFRFPLYINLTLQSIADTANSLMLPAKRYTHENLLSLSILF